MLGEIVRRADGRAFADYVSEEIFEPLDMADSWVQMTEARYAAYGDRMGAMYVTDPPSTEPPAMRGMASARGFRRALPSGSGIGPMSDLVKLFEMFLGHGERAGERVLGRSTVEAMTARHRTGMLDETFGMVIDWGLGLMVNSWHYRQRPASYGYGDHASHRTFGHGGQQSSLAFADPSRGLAVALCFNGRPGELANYRRTQAIVTAVYEDLGTAHVDWVGEDRRREPIPDVLGGNAWLPQEPGRLRQARRHARS
jgi:CubicO group peptidase (beta-lactamase class C family)